MIVENYWTRPGVSVVAKRLSAFVVVLIFATYITIYLAVNRDLAWIDAMPLGTTWRDVCGAIDASEVRVYQPYTPSSEIKRDVGWVNALLIPSRPTANDDEYFAVFRTHSGRVIRAGIIRHGQAIRFGEEPISRWVAVPDDGR